MGRTLGVATLFCGLAVSIAPAAERVDGSLSGELLQVMLQRRASRLPGLVCDGYGTVVEVIDRGNSAPQPMSASVEFIVRVDTQGLFDEVRIAHSSGDDEVDFKVADYLCNSAKVTERTLPGWNARGGWARLTIRLSG